MFWCVFYFVSHNDQTIYTMAGCFAENGIHFRDRISPLFFEALQSLSRNMLFRSSRYFDPEHSHKNLLHMVSSADALFQLMQDSKLLVIYFSNWPSIPYKITDGANRRLFHCLNSAYRTAPIDKKEIGFCPSRFF